MLSVAIYDIIHQSRPVIILFFYPVFCSVYLSVSVAEDFAFQKDFKPPLISFAIGLALFSGFLPSILML